LRILGLDVAGTAPSHLLRPRGFSLTLLHQQFRHHQAPMDMTANCPCSTVRRQDRILQWLLSHQRLRLGPHLPVGRRSGHTPLLESFKAVSRLMARVSDLGRHLVRGAGKAIMPKAASAASREPAAPIPSLRDWAAIHGPRVSKTRSQYGRSSARQHDASVSLLVNLALYMLLPQRPSSNSRSAFATSRSPTRGPSTSPVTRASQHEATATAEVVAPVTFDSESRSDVLPGVASNASRELSTPPRLPPAADEYFGGREDGRRMQLTPVQTSKSTAVPSPKWQAEVDTPVEAAHSPLALGTGRAEADTGAQERALLSASVYDRGKSSQRKFSAAGCTCHVL